MAFASEDHPNAVRVREAIQAAMAGDISKIDPLLAPNAMQRAPGLNPLSGHYPARTATSRDKTNSSSATTTTPSPSTGLVPNGVPALLTMFSAVSGSSKATR